MVTHEQHAPQSICYANARINPQSETKGPATWSTRWDLPMANTP